MKISGAFFWTLLGSIGISSACDLQISLIMPTKNRAEFAQHAIQEIQKQSYKAIKEIVVVDDSGPEDKLSSESVISLRRLIDPVRLIYVHLVGNYSIGEKRNLAINRATGDVVVHWDDDDFYGSERVAKQVAPICNGEADVTVFKLTTVFLVLKHQIAQSHYWGNHYGSLTFRRELWGSGSGQILFGNQSLAEDLAWLKGAVQVGAKLKVLIPKDTQGDPDFVCFWHGANTAHWKHMMEVPLSILHPEEVLPASMMFFLDMFHLDGMFQQMEAKRKATPVHNHFMDQLFDWNGTQQLEQTNQEPLQRILDQYQYQYQYDDSTTTAGLPSSTGPTSSAAPPVIAMFNVGIGLQTSLTSFASYASQEALEAAFLTNATNAVHSSNVSVVSVKVTGFVTAVIFSLPCSVTLQQAMAALEAYLKTTTVNVTYSGCSRRLAGTIGRRLSAVNATAQIAGNFATTKAILPLLSNASAMSTAFSKALNIQVQVTVVAPPSITTQVQVVILAATSASAAPLVSASAYPGFLLTSSIVTIVSSSPSTSSTQKKAFSGSIMFSEQKSSSALRLAAFHPSVAFISLFCGATLLAWLQEGQP